jgi:hypothetical protein
MCFDISQYVASDATESYPATPVGLDIARREIRKQMSIIAKEVDAVRTNPQTASDTISNDDTVYTNPSVFAARLPTKASTAPTNSTRQPAPALVPTPRPADPKAWQWVHVVGKDSPGHDLYRHGDGKATPEEMMLEVYRWEARNPGHIIRGFNLEGWVKRKVLQYNDLNPHSAGKDLFVRVLCDDRWKFFAGRDSCGSDVSPGGHFPRDIDIVQVLTDCSVRSDVVGFNSYGYLKNKVVLPLKPWDKLMGKPHMGIWVRNTALKP